MQRNLKYDINNVNNKSFLLREMVRMGVGIGLNRMINNNIISSEQVNKFSIERIGFYGIK